MAPNQGFGPLKLPGMTAKEVNSFYSEYTQIQNNLLGRIEEAAKAKPNFEEDKILRAMLDSSTNLREFIQYLPRDDKNRVLNSFRNLFQFESMLGDSEELLNIIKGNAPTSNSRLMEVGEDIKTGRVLRFRTEAGNITPPGKKNPLSVILNDLNINLNQPQVNRVLKMIENGDSVPEDEIRKAFKFGSNIMKADYVRGVDKIVSEGISLNNGVANIMVFDTETLGLSIGKGNIREVSASTLMYRGEAGVDELVDPFSTFFRTSASQTGMIRNPRTDQTRKLYQVFDDIAEEAYRADSTSTRIVKDVGSGEQFSDAIKQFLRQMRDADYIMGHNVQFDIDQVLVGTKLTGQYLSGTDQELVELVDQVSAKINKSGSVIDTLRVAKQKLPGLSSAPELAFAGKKTTHSIENLVLQTNLIDLMVEEAGGGQAARNQVLKMISEGLHTAKTDVRLTAELFRFMERDKIVAESLGIGKQGPGDVEFYSGVRREIRRSYAPTPISNIADVRDIDPRMFERLMQEGDDRLRFGTLDMQTGQMQRLQKIAQPGGAYSIGSFTGTAQDLQRVLSADTEPFSMMAQITPIEQEVFLTRNLVKPTYAGEVTDDMLLGLGNFRRLTGVETPRSGLINRVGTFFKRNISAGEYSEVQRTMERAGIPFAGLSLPEAQLTNIMARTTAPNAAKLSSVFGESYESVVKLADDIGISHFKLWDDAMVTHGGRLQLPVEVLRAAGVLGESGELLSLSGFDYMDKEANRLMSGLTLSMDLGEQQYDQLYKFLDETHEADLVGDTGRTLQSFLTKKGSGATKAELLMGLAETGREFGVGIGGLDDDMAETVNTVLRENALYDEFARDSNKIPFRVRLLDTFVGEGQERMARVGPFVLDRFMDDAQKANYVEASDQGRRMLDDMVEHVSRPGGRNVLAAAEFAGSTGRSDVAKRVLTSYNSAKKSAPLAIGVTALAIGGYFFAKKQRESEFYDETMEQQSTETAGDYMRYRKEMGMQPAPARRLMDPLLTSYVVGDLDANKIGHTQMGHQKYSHLYR